MCAHLVRWLALLLFVPPSYALILTGKGNQPVPARDWPTGSVEVANLPSRIGWWEGPPFGGGEWHFEYVGDTSTFQECLQTFSRIKGPKLELFIHDGTKNSFVLGTNSIDWTFVVWDTNSWERLYGNGKPIRFSDDPNAGKSLPRPRLDLYLSGRIDLPRLRLPANMEVHDERAVASGIDTSAGTVLIASITDARSGKPMKGARFVATSTEGWNRFAVSDEKGSARIEPLPGGAFQLSATADGYVEAAVAYGNYPAHGYQKFEVSLARSASVSGTVQDDAGEGVKDIRLRAVNTLLSPTAPYRSLNKSEAITDANGEFTLTNLPSGLVQIWIQSTNYFQTNIFGYHPVPGPDVPIYVRATGSLLIKIHDENGQPLNRWKDRPLHVSVENSLGAARGRWGGSANIREDGTYFFSAVHPGTYNISVTAAQKELPTEVQPNKTTTVYIPLP